MQWKWWFYSYCHLNLYNDVWHKKIKTNIKPKNKKRNEIKTQDRKPHQQKSEKTITKSNALKFSIYRIKAKSDK